MNVIFNFIHGRSLDLEATPVTASHPSRHASDCRCVCGSLVARLVSGGVELKCRRCKRVLVVPLTREALEAAAPRVSASVSGRVR